MSDKNLEIEKNRLEANLEGSKKNTFTETVIIGRIFMAIDNLKNRCVALNNQLYKKESSHLQALDAAQKKEKKEAKPKKTGEGGKKKEEGKTHSETKGFNGTFFLNDS